MVQLHKKVGVEFCEERIWDFRLLVAYGIPIQHNVCLFYKPVRAKDVNIC